MLHDLTLSGFGVRLVPLAPEHAEGLAAFVDERVWRGMTTAVPRGADDLRGEIAKAHADPARLAFAALDAESGEVRGSTSFYDWAPQVPRVEIGHTYFAPRWWGSTNNPACKYLMLRHAFEEWGCERVALRADARNARSVAAIQRLGARPEGVLRAHRRAPDGSLGGTAYFSILAPEWPAVRDGLLARLGDDAVAGQAASGSRQSGPDDERSHVVFVGGRSGVGKTTVASALHALLTERDVRHAVVEGDYLDLAHPAPHAERLAERNLAAVWSAYRELGYRRLVYTNTVSVQYADDLAAAMGDRPLVTSILLTADDQTAAARLARREHGAELDAHVTRGNAAARALDDGTPPAVHRVPTAGRAPAEIAEQIARLAGWLPGLV